MGSQLNKNYQVQKSPFSSTGLGHSWQLFNAVKRDKSHSPVTIFYLEKKKIPKANLEQCLSILKQEPSNLARLKHPFILKLLELPIQDQKIIAFATQPIECTLADLFTNMTRRGEIVPSQLQLKANLMELCNAIGFLHQTARTIHNCLNLDHVFFTKDGKLKLGGFYFSKQSTSQTDSIDIDLDFTPQPKNCPIMLPDLRFTAPEIVKNNKCSMMSDLFSLGCVLYSAASLRTSVNHHPYFIDLVEYQAQRNKSAYLAEIKKYEVSNQSGVHAQLGKYLANDLPLKNLLVKLLSISYPENRGRITDIATEQWFQDPFLKTLNYLEHLSQKENSQKVQFLNGMQRIISKFEASVTRRRILPRLTERIQLQPQLSANIIPIILNLLQQGLPQDIKKKIQKQNSSQSPSDFISNSIQNMDKKQQQQKSSQVITPQIFIDQIFPSFTKLCKGSQMPAQTMYIFIKNTQIWLYYLKNNIQTFENILFPLHLKAIDCKINKLMEISLKQINSIAKKINAMTLKSQILPRLLTIAADNQSLDLKCLSMKCVKDITPILDKRTLTDTVLDGISKMAKKITDGKICLMVIEICDELGKTLGAQTLGYKILPLLIPMMLSSNLGRDDFQRFIGIVREMINEIQKFRVKDITGNQLREKQRVLENQKIESDNKNSQMDNQFGFLDAIDGRKQKAAQAPVLQPKKQSIEKIDDFFSSMNLKQPEKSQITPSKFVDDPFAQLSQKTIPQQTEVKVGGGGGLVLKKQAVSSSSNKTSMFDNMSLSNNSNSASNNFFQTNFTKQEESKSEDPFAFLTASIPQTSSSVASNPVNGGGFDMFSNPMTSVPSASSSSSFPNNNNNTNNFGIGTTSNTFMSSNTNSFLNQNPSSTNQQPSNPFDILGAGNTQNTLTTQSNYNSNMFSQQNTTSSNNIFPPQNTTPNNNFNSFGFPPQTNNPNPSFNNNNNNQNLFSQQKDPTTDLFSQFGLSPNNNNTNTNNNLFQNTGFFQQQQQQQQQPQQNPFPNFFN